MKLLNTSQVIEKKSKFYGYFYELDNLEEIKLILNNLKKEHKKAKHVVYAYRFNNTAGKTDDKEPTGTAGLPLYQMLERKNLNKHLFVVVRYYGGVKLGAGLLMRSYQNTAILCLKKEAQ